MSVDCSSATRPVGVKGQKEAESFDQSRLKLFKSVDSVRAATLTSATTKASAASVTLRL
jgi:hypothetical protein